jgi:hypothetical protein
MYRYIEPEVSGGLGEQTKMDASVHPPIIYELEYQFDGWLENDIVESFPCYIVTARLREDIERANFSGVLFKNLKISKSDTFRDIYGNKELPEFFWLEITGNAGVDDFGIADDYRLVISERVFKILSSFNISEADFEPYDG